MYLVTRLETSVVLEPELERQVRYWDNHLKDPFAMLSGTLRKLIESGELEMTEELYNELQQPLQDTATRYVSQACTLLRSRISPWVNRKFLYHHWGLGHLHDVHVAIRAWNVGFRPRLFDLSQVARSNTESYWEEMRLKDEDIPSAEEVVGFGELRRFYENEPEELNDVALAYVSRVIHHIKGLERRAALRALGKILRPRRSQGRNHSLIILANAFAEHNPDYHYSSSEPTYKSEFEAGLSEGAEQDIMLANEQTVEFCMKYGPHIGQTYSFVTAQPRDQS